MDTSLDSTVEEIKSRLHQCGELHPGCTHGEPQQLPKRMLEISESMLYMREQVSGRHRYACLSYCWGSDGPAV